MSATQLYRFVKASRETIGEFLDSDIPTWKFANRSFYKVDGEPIDSGFFRKDTDDDKIVFSYAYISGTNFRKEIDENEFDRIEFLAPLPPQPVPEEVEKAAEDLFPVYESMSGIERYSQYSKRHGFVQGASYLAGASSVNATPEIVGDLGSNNGLLDCPYCGGKEGFDVLIGRLSDIPKFKVVCIPCGLAMIDDRKDKVIANWNRRASSVNVDVLVRALEEVVHHFDTWPSEPERAVRISRKVIMQALAAHQSSGPAATTDEALARKQMQSD